jgi:hypothetical protein
MQQSSFAKQGQQGKNLGPTAAYSSPPHVQSTTMSTPQGGRTTHARHFSESPYHCLLDMIEVEDEDQTKGAASLVRKCWGILVRERLINGLEGYR